MQIQAQGIATDNFVKNLPVSFRSRLPFGIIGIISPLFVGSDFSSVLHAIKYLVLNAPTDAAADGNVIIISTRLSTIILLSQITSEAGWFKRKENQIGNIWKKMSNLKKGYAFVALECFEDSHDDSPPSLFKI